jgi:tetratricopeptide (TPR) repeat protein
MFELKPLSKEAIPAALEKAEHYRLLNEPNPAVSICLDILEVDPDNQKALISIVLAMSDNFSEDYSVGDAEVKEYVARIEDEYKRTYYTGIVFERRAKAILNNGPEGSESTAFELFRQAMDWFEKAESISPEENDDAILRWNGCARMINNNNLRPRRVHGDFIE